MQSTDKIPTVHDEIMAAKAHFFTNNRANYQKPQISNDFTLNKSDEKLGMINDFSTVPKVAAEGVLEVYENAVFFHHPNQFLFKHEPPPRQENDIKCFSAKSRKNLFNIFNTLRYSLYGLPCFVSATWHYDSPEKLTQVKSFLENYVKRLKRCLPKFHAIWKLEYQQRGTPHFHFILLPLDKNINMWNPENEQLIKKHWLELKSCKCKKCEKFSIKTVSVLNYKMAISYISKEIAKVQDNYQTHDLGRVWGTSQQLICEPIANVVCSVSTYHKILDRKLEEFENINSTWLYVNGIRFLEQNSSVFISSSKISDIILKLKVEKKIPELSYKKYFIKHKIKSE